MHVRKGGEEGVVLQLHGNYAGVDRAAAAASFGFSIVVGVEESPGLSARVSDAGYGNQEEGVEAVKHIL